MGVDDWRSVWISGEGNERAFYELGLGEEDVMCFNTVYI